MTQELSQVAQATRRIQEQVQRVIVGKSHVIELVLVAALCESNVLVEDVPGIGKTLLARSVARALGCSFRRLQCTPDLLPSDVTGTYVFNQQTSTFQFRAGPIFTQVLLVDEINRSTPRTQSALLEAMEERQVTIEGETHALPRPFLVLATQNPVELEGTFPLPEAQLDRFLVRVRLGYPAADEDREILRRFREADPLEELKPVSSAEELLALGRLCRQVRVDQEIEEYLIALIRATRAHAEVQLGASPRAMQRLYRASQALAAVRGRNYVIPDDVKELAPNVLEHRLVLRAQGHLRGHTPADVLREVLKATPVPVESASGASERKA